MKELDYYNKLFRGSLDKITVEELHNRIEKFKEIDLKTISDKELKKRIKQVISYNLKDKSYGGGFVYTTTFNLGTQFYRVRKFDTKELNVAMTKMKIEKDAWEPPLVKNRGRLNIAGESLLYTCPYTQETAIEEMKIHEGEFFALITYESTENISAIKIGEWKKNNNFSKEQNQKLRIIKNFLHSEFTKDVGIGKEYLYRVSEIIIKDYFDFLPISEQQAWCYPSVKLKNEYNVCFRSKIHKKILKLKGVAICEIKRNNSKILIGAHRVAHELNLKGEFIYVLPNEKIMNEMFPNHNPN
ncbi:hypothetical protein [uncultured Psychroserpens sp.]|uniref:hypothetical protein n=1 Tax=uncultured Psychroserpens sp. TaxID=255436 RepID=UPI00261687B8|nr:hypothetical protein [uncultured Psychroserpens sp.]